MLIAASPCGKAAPIASYADGIRALVFPMQDNSFFSLSVGNVEVQLLDPSSGRPIKSWVFNEQAQISIGRLAGQDVEIADPYVSRIHANLTYQEGEWHLISLGTNGILVANQFIKEHVLQSEQSFRLGPEGPTLRFRKAAEHDSNLKTITFDAAPTMLFELDKRKLQSEVGEIAEGDYFKALQQRAKDMRRQKSEV